MMGRGPDTAVSGVELFVVRRVDTVDTVGIQTNNPFEFNVAVLA